MFGCYIADISPTHHHNHRHTIIDSCLTLSRHLGRLLSEASVKSQRDAKISWKQLASFSRLFLVSTLSRARFSFCHKVRCYPAAKLGQVKKKKDVARPDFYKKKGRAGGFFCYLLFPIACLLYRLLPSPRDTLELLGQILIKRNISYCLNTSLFNFDTHKGLTVKIYIILVCTE